MAAFDKGQVQAEKIIPFDTFFQVIDGKAEIVIDGISNLIGIGHSIIIPAHASSTFIALGSFKMISTIIKSGYE